MSYYADCDRYLYGTTAREAFDELDRLESRIARDRRRASLTAASPAADSRRLAGGDVDGTPAPGPASLGERAS